MAQISKLTNSVMAYRLVLGHDRRLMAENIGISTYLLHSIEYEIRLPDLITAMKISNYLNKQVNELFKLI